MPAILSKNCVLAGEVECYCLVCCVLLPAEHDVLAHIQLASHERNLSSHAYLHKFEHDYIRKVAGVYFCEFCNTTLPTAAKVSLHVTELTHVERRRARMLTRGDNCIMFNENIKITENAWNGLVDDTCVLCDAEFEDESVHKSGQNHILNLIRNKVTFGVNNEIYRKVNGTYQCLTCNKIVCSNVIEHFESMEHKGLLTKVNQNETDITNKESEEDPKNKTADTEDVTRERNRKSKEDVQSDTTDNTTAEDKAEQTEAKEKVCILVSYEEDDEVWKKCELSFVETCNLAYKEAYSTYNSSTLHTVKQYAARDGYRKKIPKRFNATRNVSKYTVTKMSMQSFTIVSQFFQFRSYTSSEFIPFVLVKDFCLNVAKVIGLANFRGKIFCQFCSKVLTPETLEAHIDSSKHKDILENAYVIISLEGEFVRELKPNLFDCTYCGHVERDWGDMLDHLESDEHQKSKDYHEKVLLGYKMSLMQRDLQNLHIMRLF